MGDLFEDQDREHYQEALSAFTDANIPFMLGGAFAIYHYTGWWRHTHDIDVYVTPDHVQRAIEALDSVGFKDIGEQAEGDRAWIYHAGKHALVFDVIYRFANMPNYVAPDWIERASPGEFLGMDLLFLPLEELIWVKIYVINRHRCDWPDIMRLIKRQCKCVNWNRLMDMLGENWLLLAGLVDLFDWQHPDCLDCIPDFVREEFANRRKQYRVDHPTNVEREHLLDPWIHLRADRYEAWRNEQPNDRCL